MGLRLGIPYESKYLAGWDGTRIHYVVAGAGERTFVLCPGLGGPIASYRPLFERFGRDFRFVCWDPRGLYRSATPEAGVASMRVEDHISDLERIVERERLDRFVLGGWSMGVQLSLEYAARHPEKPQALVLMNGAYGHVLSTAIGGEGSDWLTVPLARLASRLGPAINLAARNLLDRGPTIAALRLLGFVSEDTPFFREVAAEFKQVEFGQYLRMVLALNEHTAAPHLAGIDQPALVTVGTKDTLTPPRVGEDLIRRMPRAELVTIPNGTHYTILEYPALVCDAVARFLDRELRREERRIG